MSGFQYHFTVVFESHTESSASNRERERDTVKGKEQGLLLLRLRRELRQEEGVAVGIYGVDVSSPDYKKPGRSDTSSVLIS